MIFFFFLKVIDLEENSRDKKGQFFDANFFEKVSPNPRLEYFKERRRKEGKEEAVVAPWLSSFRSFTGPVVADNILTSFKSNEVYTHTHRYIRTRNTGERGNTSRVPRTPMHISSRAHPSYTRASEEVLFCTFPTLQPIFLCAITSASATDCERRMSRPIRNFLLRFVQDHSRQLKSSASSSPVHTNAPLLHHFFPFQSLFLFFSFLSLFLFYFPITLIVSSLSLSLHAFRSSPLFIVFFEESKKKFSLIPHWIIQFLFIFFFFSFNSNRENKRNWNSLPPPRGWSMHEWMCMYGNARRTMEVVTVPGKTLPYLHIRRLLHLKSEHDTKAR